MSAHAARASDGVEPPAAVLARAAERCWLAVAIAAAVLVACFYATGGLDLRSETTTEIVLTLGSGVLVALAIAQEGARRGRLWGAGTAGAFAILAGFTALSLGWSAEPSDSWIEAGRTLSYAAAFAGAVALVRLAADRWRSVLAGILLATTVISAYAVATKVFPGATPVISEPARLRAPFGYWNVIGLIAALGVPPALWLGTRREGHGAFAALTPPSICLALVTVMLSYSRGALLALIVGLIFWFVFVPLRLRSAGQLAIGLAGAGIVIAWEFSQSALTSDYNLPATTSNVPWPAHVSAGHELGGLLLGVLVACAAAGLLARFALLRNPPSARLRRQTAIALLVCVALVPVVAVIGLAASSRGLTGAVSHDFNSLVNTNASVSNSASRLTSFGNEHAAYWRDALDAFAANPGVGAGAGSYATTHTRYDTTLINVQQAHGYIFQTLADLGLVGLGLSLLLVGGWIAAALRAAGPLRVRSEPGPSESAERIGLLTMVTVVVIFAVHSTFDFDWFIPGAMLIVLLCAGWVAGRGSYAAELGPGRVRAAALREHPPVALACAVAVAMALLVAWLQWQPLRSYDAYNASETALGNHQYVLARADAQTAASENPLDYQPLVWLALAEFDMHRERAAYATMVRAVRLQPSNPQTWFNLAEFDYYNLDDAADALKALRPALYLDPQNADIQTLYTELLPAAGSAGASSGG